MQTFEKLTLRFTTNVTTSPTCRRRSSSATLTSASRSRPRASARTIPSATDTSRPSSATLRIERTSREAWSSARAPLPASPVFMRLLYEAGGVDERRHARSERFVEELGTLRVLRIDREALAQREAGLRRVVPEACDLRPRLLGIDVIEGERRDAAPIVETGREQVRILARREIGRRLHVHVGPEQQARDGDGAREVGERRLRRVAHRDARLGAEVLDDDFLDVTVALVQIADGGERVDALGGRLADPDQDPGRERDCELAGESDRAQATRRHL